MPIAPLIPTWTSITAQFVINISRIMQSSANNYKPLKITMPRYDLPLPLNTSSSSRGVRYPYSQMSSPMDDVIPPFPSTRLAHNKHRRSSPEQLARDMAAIEESFADASMCPTRTPAAITTSSNRTHVRSTTTKWKGGKDENGIAHWVADVQCGGRGPNNNNVHPNQRSTAQERQVSAVAPSVSAPAPARHALNPSASPTQLRSNPHNDPHHPHPHHNHHRAPSFALSPRVLAPPALSTHPSFEGHGTNSRSEFDYYSGGDDDDDFEDFDEDVLTAFSSGVSTRTTTTTTTSVSGSQRNGNLSSSTKMSVKDSQVTVHPTANRSVPPSPVTPFTLSPAPASITPAPLSPNLNTHTTHPSHAHAHHPHPNPHHHYHHQHQNPPSALTQRLWPPAATNAGVGKGVNANGGAIAQQQRTRRKKTTFQLGGSSSPFDSSDSEDGGSWYSGSDSASGSGSDGDRRPVPQPNHHHHHQQQQQQHYLNPVGPQPRRGGNETVGMKVMSVYEAGLSDEAVWASRGRTSGRRYPPSHPAHPTTAASTAASGVALVPSAGVGRRVFV
ncbi:uncharacterized protein EI90DRAFT_1822110 [Cantharellus anzutake]|uniref:uncharacterized protein n=1 Tax=Cantharellus anzutake TaxID=1750568 RepID=UPI001902CE03|nr:uncharacterized protein EI90DRAFT_1822110 [Cantharellus anzutake]KAF8327161.1 hypothetical protein EI90DRAFT_1822110 [Cantharellus anzutake]